MSRFQRGDRVVHPKCPDWGVGQVVQGGEPGGKVKALFERAGVKTVLTDHLEPAPPAEPVRKGKPPW
ncbi:MAG TPA: DUF3553 domain-containing protein [Myxococcota bacterium]|nr:DUF3553 domain-containing protein [Myxococcota bacterium]